MAPHHARIAPESPSASTPTSAQQTNISTTCQPASPSTQDLRKSNMVDAVEPCGGWCNYVGRLLGCFDSLSQSRCDGLTSNSRTPCNSGVPNRQPQAKQHRRCSRGDEKKNRNTPATNKVSDSESESHGSHKKGNSLPPLQDNNYHDSNLPNMYRLFSYGSEGDDETCTMAKSRHDIANDPTTSSDKLQTTDPLSLRACAICFDSYDQENLEPRLLKLCTHAVCKECFIGVQVAAAAGARAAGAGRDSAKYTPRCPVCRLQVNLTEPGKKPGVIKGGQTAETGTNVDL